ncbi:hypothetical protein predicted by Glimmer/Critica [Lactiplantibacillus plantarum]|nr:hypothetical protein predicted by Glimmer/Critica [Lactiplantibacillus plantarum]
MGSGDTIVAGLGGVTSTTVPVAVTVVPLVLLVDAVTVVPAFKKVPTLAVA